MPRRIEPQKSKRKYKFNGVWGMKPQDLKTLQEHRKSLLKKLGDPSDTDDPIWVKTWLAATEAEIAKKTRNRSQKSREKKPASRRAEKPKS